MVEKIMTISVIITGHRNATCIAKQNIYFTLRFGLVKLTNTYLGLKIRVVRGERIFSFKCILFEFTI